MATPTLHPGWVCALALAGCVAEPSRRADPAEDAGTCAPSWPADWDALAQQARSERITRFAEPLRALVAQARMYMGAARYVVRVSGPDGPQVEAMAANVWAVVVPVSWPEAGEMLLLVGPNQRTAGVRWIDGEARLSNLLQCGPPTAFPVACPDCPGPPGPAVAYGLDAGGMDQTLNGGDPIEINAVLMLEPAMPQTFPALFNLYNAGCVDDVWFDHLPPVWQRTVEVEVSEPVPDPPLACAIPCTADAHCERVLLSGCRRRAQAQVPESARHEPPFEFAVGSPTFEAHAVCCDHADPRGGAALFERCFDLPLP